MTFAKSRKTRSYSLPFPAWYPFNVKSSPAYELTYLHQLISHIFIATGGCNVDMLVIALMMYVGVQCEILCDDLKNLDPRDFTGSLKSCIRHHKEILNFAASCNKFFNLIVMGQLTANMVSVAMCCFRLAMVTPAQYQFYYQFGCIFCLILQVFILCWFGNEITVKSDKISESAFESNWVGQSLQAQRSLFIFLETTQKSIKPSSFNLIYLSLDTFIRFVRMSVSYYTVLQQLNSGK
ncbi:hypothetical protein MTP99_008883 [Tenebrio molitor]|nr:hypothetical protein MTP99_008883 [Tenebrio molitor]